MRFRIAVITAALSVAVLTGTATAQAPVPADQAARLAEAQAIIDIMLPPAQRQQTFDTLLANVDAQFRRGMDAQSFGDPGLKQVLEDSMNAVRPRQVALIQKHLPDIIEATVLAYTHEFSLAELKDIHAFATTPTGRRYLSRSTALVGDPSVAEANAALFADAQTLAASVRTEVAAKVVDYLKAHPDVTKRISAQLKKP